MTAHVDPGSERREAASARARHEQWSVIGDRPVTPHVVASSSERTLEDGDARRPGYDRENMPPGCRVAAPPSIPCRPRWRGLALCGQDVPVDAIEPGDAGILRGGKLQLRGDGLDGLWLWPVALDDPFKPTALRDGDSCGPEGWIGEYEGKGTLSGSEIPFSVIVAIDGFTGDWMSVDPVDPPRLLATFARDLVGPFEAVHCAALDRYFWECA